MSGNVKVLLILMLAPFVLVYQPVSYKSVTVSLHEQYQNSENEAAK